MKKKKIDRNLKKIDKEMNNSFKYVREWAEKVIKYPVLGWPGPYMFAVEESLQESMPEPYPGFLTLDMNFRLSFLELRTKLKDYLSNTDIKRPYNILIMAKPGSGKSYFVNCLSKVASIPLVGGNLSGKNSIENLITVINEVRNYKVVNKVPILSLDEADSDPNNISLLLPLLYDGEISYKGQLLKIGRCIIICIVSDTKLVNYIKKQQNEKFILKKYQKIVDFKSRFNGGFFSIPSINEKRRRFDKVWIAFELLRKRFGYVGSIPIYFLQFIANSKFLHEVRSLEALINAIPNSAFHHGEELVIDSDCVDLIKKDMDKETAGPLSYHISCGDKALQYLEKCRRLNKDNINSEHFVFYDFYTWKDLE